MFRSTYRRFPECFCITFHLLALLLILWGCDGTVDIPTAGSMEDSSAMETTGQNQAELDGIVTEDGNQAMAAPMAANLIPLNRYWDGISTDYLTIAQPIAPLGAPAQGHVFAGVAGRVFAAQQSGTIPLKLFWNSTRKDYLTTTSNVVPPGYAIIRIEGFVFAKQASGTVPLKVFWNAALADYLTTTGVAPMGYVHVHTEGYVAP